MATTQAAILLRSTNFATTIIKTISRTALVFPLKRFHKREHLLERKKSNPRH